MKTHPLTFALAVGWGATVLFHDAIWKPQINISPTPIIFSGAMPAISSTTKLPGGGGGGSTTTPSQTADDAKEVSLCDVEVPILLQGTRERDIERAGALVQAMHCGIGKRVTDPSSTIKILLELNGGESSDPSSIEDPFKFRSTIEIYCGDDLKCRTDCADPASICHQDLFGHNNWRPD